MPNKGLLYLVPLLLGLCASSIASPVTVTMTSPTAGATVSPVHVQAKATAAQGISGWKIYLDNSAVYSTGAVTSISTDLTVATGQHTIVVKAWDSNGHSGSASAGITVGTTQTTLTINTTALPGDNVGTPYSVALSASGGTSPYNWNLASGQLPPGLALGSSGTINGTPTSTGQYSFSVQAKDSTSTPQTASKALSIAVGSATPSALSISTSTLPGGTDGLSYSSTLSATGGTAPYTWSVVSGQLPPGLTLSTSGTIKGQPIISGDYYFSVQSKDSASTPQAATTSLMIKVTPNFSGIVMNADMETGDLSQWTGAAADSGLCTYHGVSTDFAHTGKYSMKLTIDTSQGSAGCRQHDSWSKNGKTYYYSAWYYIPTYTAAKDWWNIFQFKGKDYVTGANDPLYTINVVPKSAGGPLTLRLCWWPAAGYGTAHNQAPVNGPYATSDESKKFYSETLKDVPVGKWFQIEAYLVQSGQFDGHLTVWMDGVQLWDFVNVRTHFPDLNAPSTWPHQWWAVNNYSNGLTPSPASLYIDDGKVSTVRVGP